MNRILFIISILLFNLLSYSQDTTAIKLSLGEKDYQDFKNWVALGIGGIPHSLEGYRNMKELSKQMKNPFDYSGLIQDMGKTGDVNSLKNLPLRKGVKPVIAPYAVPHRQTNQHNDTVIRMQQKKIFDDIVTNSNGKLIYNTSFLEKNSPGIFLKDSAAGNQTIVQISHAEIGHIHMFDGSMHIILSPSDTKEVIEKGWGELHGLAGQGRAAKTYMMIYSPRDEIELEITKQILMAAVRYSTAVAK
jgi:hypothetical protein